MPPTSAVRAWGSTRSTRPNADTSRPEERLPPLNRNRFEVGLASRTGLPGGIAAYARCRSATAAWWAAGAWRTAAAPAAAAAAPGAAPDAPGSLVPVTSVTQPPCVGPYPGPTARMHAGGRYGQGLCRA